MMKLHELPILVEKLNNKITLNRGYAVDILVAFQYPRRVEDFAVRIDEGDNCWFSAEDLTVDELVENLFKLWKAEAAANPMRQ